MIFRSQIFLIMYLCEYLPRLNTISITVDFPEEIKEITGLSLKGGKVYIKTSKEYILELPISEVDLQLQILKKTSHDTLLISFKCPNKSQSNNFMNLLENQLWSCKDLLKTPKDDRNRNIFLFKCNKCDCKIIDSTSIKRFSDLPSEFWSEMMDFWHCHKPHTHQPHNKNYNGDITPQEDLIIIGNYYFLLNKKQPISSLNVNNNKVYCNCGNVLGETTTTAIKIFKWTLVLEYNSNIERYPSYLYVYNILLDKINLYATRKVFVNNYLIWIFNIGIDVTFQDVKLLNGLKVLYCKTDNKDVSDEQIIVDKEIFEAFLNELNEINKLFPAQGRLVQMKEDDTFVNYNISYIGLHV